MQQLTSKGLLTGLLWLRYYTEMTTLDKNIVRDCAFFPSALSVCCRKFEGSSYTSNGSASIHEMWQIGPCLKFKWRLIASANSAGPSAELFQGMTRDKEYILALQQAI